VEALDSVLVLCIMLDMTSLRSIRFSYVSPHNVEHLALVYTIRSCMPSYQLWWLDVYPLSAQMECIYSCHFAFTVIVSE